MHTHVVLVTRGEWEPEDILAQLRPDTIAKRYSEGSFMIHELSFTQYGTREELTLLRAKVAGSISDYEAILDSEGDPS